MEIVDPKDRLYNLKAKREIDKYSGHDRELAILFYKKLRVSYPAVVEHRRRQAELEAEQERLEVEQRMFAVVSGSSFSSPHNLPRWARVNQE